MSLPATDGNNKHTWANSQKDSSNNIVRLRYFIRREDQDNARNI